MFFQAHTCQKTCEGGFWSLEICKLLRTKMRKLLSCSVTDKEDNSVCLKATFLYSLKVWETQWSRKKKKNDFEMKTSTSNVNAAMKDETFFSRDEQ